MPSHEILHLSLGPSSVMLASVRKFVSGSAVLTDFALNRLALNPWCEGIDDRRNANATLVQRYLCRYGEEQTFWAPFGKIGDSDLLPKYESNVQKVQI